MESFGYGISLQEDADEATLKGDSYLRTIQPVWGDDVRNERETDRKRKSIANKKKKQMAAGQSTTDQPAAGEVSIEESEDLIDSMTSDEDEAHQQPNDDPVALFASLARGDDQQHSPSVLNDRKMFSQFVSKLQRAKCRFVEEPFPANNLERSPPILAI